MLKFFDNKCLRKITNKHWKEFQSNRTLIEETKQELVLMFKKKTQLEISRTRVENGQGKTSPTGFQQDTSENKKS
jgi:hypothetical protein